MEKGTKLDLEVSSLYFLFKGKSHKTDHLSNQRPISYEKNIRTPQFTAYLKTKLLSEIHLSFEAKRQSKSNWDSTGVWGRGQKIPGSHEAKARLDGRMDSVISWPQKCHHPPLCTQERRGSWLSPWPA